MIMARVMVRVIRVRLSTHPLRGVISLRLPNGDLVPGRVRDTESEGIHLYLLCECVCVCVRVRGAGRGLPGS